MSRSIDNMMADFEFVCLRTKNGLMSRFFYETWEFKLHNKAKKLFKFIDYLNHKMHYYENGKRLSIDEIVETDAYRLKRILENKIEEVQYHNVSTHAARILYESYDSENGYWS